MAEEQNSAKARYIDTWIEMLGQILGWSPEQVLRWVDERFGKDLDDPHDLYYHRYATEWGIQKIVSDLFEAELHNDLDSIDLRHKIQAAFWQDYRMHSVPRGTDLSVFRQRVEAILDEYRKNKAP